MVGAIVYYCTNMLQNMSVNVISLNVRGLREQVKRRNIFDFYRSRCDILCLQETHSTPEDIAVWKIRMGREGLLVAWNI